MVAVAITIKSLGLGKLIDDVHELTKAPSGKTKAALKLGLDTAFNYTQGQIDIDTGSLKASGHTSAGVEGSLWHGTIFYGGNKMYRPVVPGPKKNVHYALYEMGRGGPHDFLAGIEQFDGVFEKAIDTFFHPLKGD